MAIEYVPDFELGEDAPRNVAARLAQEAQWASTQIDARQHFSVREATKLFQPALLDAQDDFYVVRALVAGQQRAGAGTLLAALSAELLALIVELAMPGQGPLVLALIAREHERPRAREAQRESDALAPFRVFVRVRPLLPYELEAGEHGALDCASSARALVCHDGRLGRSGRRLTMTHRFYAADAIFPPDADEARVFEGALAPLLARVADGRGDGTLICYGQTGAGKTHTLMQLLGQLAASLDCMAAAEGELRSAAAEGASAAEGPALVEVTFFEVGGREHANGGAHDLLNARAAVRLRCDEAGETHAVGAAARPAHDGRSLLAALADGLALRSTEETERNPISSRSHAVCALRFARSGRTLRLVDLAGSERNHDTAAMSAAQHRTSAEINRALFALKECFRQAARAHALPAGASAASARVPYRSSTLTRVLRGCFTDGGHRTSLVAAVSPGSADVLHTTNSLDHVCLMAPHLALAPAGGGGAGAISCAGAAAAGASHSVCLDVPMRRRRRAELATAGGLAAELAYERLPVHEWAEEHVLSWLANAHAGRFAQVVVPRGTDGRKLLALSARRLTELVEDAERIGRGGAGVHDEHGGPAEGAAGAGALGGAGGADGPAAAAPAGGQQPPAAEVGWYISSQAKVGRALFAALRDEQKGRFASISEAPLEVW